MATRNHEKRGKRSPNRLPVREGVVRVAIGLLAIYGTVSLGVEVAHTVHSSTVLGEESPDITMPWASDTVTKWKGPIDAMAAKYDIDPDLVAIIMTLESGGYSKAGSQAGAKGLMQVTDPTAKDIAAKYLKEPRKDYDLWDPSTNIEFGVAYLAHLRDVFGDREQGPPWDSSVELIAAAYNGGPGAANRILKGEGLLDVETVSYSRDAFNMWRERHAKTSPTYQRWLERGGQHLIDEARTEK